MDEVRKFIRNHIAWPSHIDSVVRQFAVVLPQLEMEKAFVR